MGPYTRRDQVPRASNHAANGTRGYIAVSSYTLCLLYLWNKTSRKNMMNDAKKCSRQKIIWYRKTLFVVEKMTCRKLWILSLHYPIIFYSCIFVIGRNSSAWYDRIVRWRKDVGMKHWNKIKKNMNDTKK